MRWICVLVFLAACGGEATTDAPDAAGTKADARAGGADARPTADAGPDARPPADASPDAAPIIERCMPKPETHLEMPAAGSCARTFSAGPDLAGKRESHAALVLDDGSLLVAGGSDRSRLLLTAERLPSGGASWQAAGAMPPAAVNAFGLPSGLVPALTPLAGGAVLITNRDFIETDLLDAQHTTWTATGMTDSYLQYLTVGLADGRVLIAGGFREGQLGDPDSRVWIYSPDSGDWDYGKMLVSARGNADGLLLADGRVLVLGGDDGRGLSPSAELYDPETMVARMTGSPLLPRSHPALVRLLNGEVLMVGGARGSAPTASVERFDPTSGRWRTTAFLQVARRNHTVTLLPDGKVLVVGGRAGESAAIGSSEVYDPAAETWVFGADLKQARYGHTASLAGDRVIVAGGDDGARTLASTEIVALGALCNEGAGASVEELCRAAAAACGTVMTTDVCGNKRSVSCGTSCFGTATCGGGGVANRCGAASTTEFAIDVLDTPSSELLGARLVLDDQDRPTLAFGWADPGGVGPRLVKVAQPTATGWTLTPLASWTLGSSRFAIGMALAGRAPQVSFSIGGPFIARWTGSDWQRDAVSSLLQFPLFNPSYGRTALALDAGGAPHLCAEDTGITFPGVTCFHGDTTPWKQSGPSGAGNTRPSMAIDAAGRTHVALYDSSAKDLRYAHQTDAGWTIETVASDGDTGDFPALALDAAGHPRIAYIDRAAGAVKLAELGDAWTITTVATAAASDTALVLDASGRPHIAYVDTAAHAVKLAEWTGSAWKATTVDVVAHSGYAGGVSLALDKAGRPRLAYQSAPSFQYEVRYARPK